MTSPCGELLPDDVMIVADLGKTENGIQQISTVARALSIRQTKETTAANAAFIIKSVNNHDALVKALKEIAENPAMDPGGNSQIAREALAGLVGEQPK